MFIPFHTISITDILPQAPLITDHGQHEVGFSPRLKIQATKT